MGAAVSITVAGRQKNLNELLKINRLIHNIFAILADNFLAL
jgi:hypothetical protein